MGNESWRLSQRESWEREYKKSPRLWKGAADLDSCPEGGGTVLELGCGDGKTLLGLAESGRRVTGLDHSLTALKKCSARSKSSDLIELIVGDVTNLPLADRSFEVILAFHIIDHLVEAERIEAVAEMERVLARGGRAVVRVFSTRDMRAGEGREVEGGTLLKGSGIICHYFTESELADLFSRMKAKRIVERTVEKRFRGRTHRRVELEAVFVRSDRGERP